jgi:hypothetical protein
MGKSKSLFEDKEMLNQLVKNGRYSKEEVERLAKKAIQGKIESHFYASLSALQRARQNS